MGRLVWITGASGFLGSHLSRALRSVGHEVIGFGRRGAMANNADATSYSLTAEGFASALKEHGEPKRVYHLAGGATVGRSLTDPGSDFQSNTVTTHVLFEALRLEKIAAPVVLTSSAAVYGNSYTGGIGTDFQLAPTSPYGSHKAMAEQLVWSRARCFEVSATILRLFSIYGPGLQKQLLFDVCTRLNDGQETSPLLLDGSGGELRDWLHVEDAVDAMVSIGDPPAGDVQVYNLASGLGTEIQKIALGLLDAWGSDRKLEFTNMMRPGDPFSLVASPSSLPSGFAPKVNLAAGLEGFVEWFRSHDEIVENAV